MVTLRHNSFHKYHLFNGPVSNVIMFISKLSFRTDTMIHPAPLLLLLISFAAPTPAQADSVLYVKPTEGTKCPGEPCHTLDEYVNETHHHENFPYYNNTVMKFLPGTHNLSVEFNFHNLTNLTLEATHPTRMNETVICCNDHPQALLFTHGSQISIEGLSIVNCSAHNSSGYLPPIGISTLYIVKELCLCQNI